MTTTNSAATVHVFEKAGLGKAPFRCIGHERRTYVACPGAPVQPGGSCDYCGTGITDCYIIRSADGREFKVGCDCVAKTGDRGLRRQLADVERKVSAEKRADLATRKKAQAEAMLADENVRAMLAAKPHYRGFTDRETGRALTMLDWAEWMMANAGARGRAGVLKYIKEQTANASN